MISDAVAQRYRVGCGGAGGGVDGGWGTNNSTVFHGIYTLNSHRKRNQTVFVYIYTKTVRFLFIYLYLKIWRATLGTFVFFNRQLLFRSYACVVKKKEKGGWAFLGNRHIQYKRDLVMEINDYIVHVLKT